MLHKRAGEGDRKADGEGQGPRGIGSAGHAWKFSRVMRLRDFEEDRRKAVIEGLAENRFRFLLEMPQKSDELKKLIFKHAEKAWPRHDSLVLRTAIDYVDSFYSGILRKDGKTEASAHIYSVAYGCLLLGCGFETLIAALFHDLREDTREKWSKKSLEQVGEDMTRIAGEGICEKSRLMTHSKTDPYPEYLTKIYQSRDLELMVVKAVDMTHNLFTLYFEGCSEKMRNSVVRKAIYHVDIWRKFNREFFELMFALIRDNAPEKAGNRMQEEILSRIEELRHPSVRQLQKERDKIVIVNSRKRLNLALFSDLPNSGSQVITVYAPGHLEADSTMEVEFPAGAGTPAEVHARLKKSLPWMEFQPVKSELPPGLVCTSIFKTNVPPAKRSEDFLEALKALASSQGNLHGKTTEFYGST